MTADLKSPMEKMVETFLERCGDDPRHFASAGLRAVLEKHIGPMLAEAYEMALLNCDVPFDHELDGKKATARILSSLTKENGT